MYSLTETHPITHPAQTYNAAYLHSDTCVQMYLQKGFGSFDEGRWSLRHELEKYEFF